MAYNTTLGEMLAQRMQSASTPPAPAGMGALLGPLLAAPLPTSPRLDLQSLLAGTGQAMTQVPDKGPSVPAVAQAPMEPAAGSAAATEAGPSPLSGLLALLDKMPTSNAQQATPRPDNLAEAVGSAAAQDRAATPEIPSPYPPAANPLEALFGLFGGGGAAAPAPAPEAAASQPQQPPTPATAPAQQAAAPATPTPAPEAAASAAQPAEKKTQAITKAIETAYPDLPKADTASAVSAFENVDLFKAMIAMGASLSSGRTFGEAAAMGANAFLQSQAGRQQAANAARDKRLQEAQTSFENELKLSKEKREGASAASAADLRTAQAEAARAKIPLTAEQVKLVKAQTAKAMADTAKAGRETSGQLAPKDYAKLMLDVQKDMELNGTVPEDIPVTDESRIRVNLALPENLRQYSPVPSAVKAEVQGIAQKPELTEEDKTRLERYRLLYGPVI